MTEHRPCPREPMLMSAKGQEQLIHSGEPLLLINHAQRAVTKSTETISGRAQLRGTA
jgi:hypothetical protein